jgi:hypothetical protein
MLHIAQKLEEIVASVHAGLKAVNAEAAALHPSVGQWSPKEIVGHLIDSASNNHQRFVRLLEDGELTFPPYAQEAWVRLQVYNDADWNTLLSLWRTYNLHLAHLIRQVPAERLACCCTLGGQDSVTLKFLIEDYLAHLQLHLKQIAQQTGSAALDLW